MNAFRSFAGAGLLVLIASCSGGSHEVPSVSQPTLSQPAAFRNAAVSPYFGYFGTSGSSIYDTLRVFNEGSVTLVKSIQVDGGPIAEAVNAANHRAYFSRKARYGTGQSYFDVIDSTTNTIVHEIALGVIPNFTPTYNVAVSQNDYVGYVFGEKLRNTKELVKLGLQTNRVLGTLTLGPVTHPTDLVPDPPSFVVFNPSPLKAYIAYAQWDDVGTIAVINAATNTVAAKIHLPAGAPAGIAVNPAGTRLYVAMNTAAGNAPATLYVIDAASNAVLKAIRITGGSEQLAVSPDGKTIIATSAYGGSPGAGSIDVVNAVTYTARRVSVPGGSDAWGVDYSHDGSQLYLAGGKGVTLVNPSTYTVERQLVTSDPYAFAAGDFAQ